MQQKYNFHSKGAAMIQTIQSVGTGVLYWMRGWVTKINPLELYSFSPKLKYSNITNAAHLCLFFFKAEKHAGVSCVTASVDDIQFEETAR